MQPLQIEIELNASYRQFFGEECSNNEVIKYENYSHVIVQLRCKCILIYIKRLKKEKKCVIII